MGYSFPPCPFFLRCRCADLLHPSPAHIETSKIFQIYFPKCPSFSIIQGYPWSAHILYVSLIGLCVPLLQMCGHFGYLTVVRPFVSRCFKLQLYIINAFYKVYRFEYQFCLEQVVSGLYKLGVYVGSTRNKIIHLLKFNVPVDPDIILIWICSAVTCGHADRER
jgi:hypothetical protein